MISLLQPAMLWGLLGLLVPIAIHLLHKRSQKVIMVGSLQPYRGGKPVQARRLQLNELGLLLLRCFLLALFVLLLTQPILIKDRSVQKRYLFIAPELLGSLRADSLREAGFEPGLLQPGLPLLQEGAVADTSNYSYWDVFREIEGLADAGDTVWLHLDPRLYRFSGRRPALNTIFQPLAVSDVVESERTLAQLLQQPQEQVLLRWWEKEAQHWMLKQREISLLDTAKALEAFKASATLEVPDTLKVGIWSDADLRREARLWEQALNLIDSLQPATIFAVTQAEIGKEEVFNDLDVKVWLSKADPPAPFLQNKTGKKMILQKGNSNRWFIKDRAEPSLYHIKLLLTEQQNNRQRLADFIPALQQVLLSERELSNPPVLLSKAQWQPVHIPEKELKVKRQGEPLEQWILLFLLMILILERWLSLRK